MIKIHHVAGLLAAAGLSGCIVLPPPPSAQMCFGPMTTAGWHGDTPPGPPPRFMPPPRRMPMQPDGPDIDPQDQPGH